MRRNAPASLAITPAAPSDKETLRRLMQFYCYDFSEITNMPLSTKGEFGDKSFIEEQFSPPFQTFLFLLDEEPVGFAIVSDRSYLSDNAGVFDMAQFFVMRANRRLGHGRDAAHALFQLFPGPWEIRVLKENEVAQNFWRGVISGYSGKEPDIFDHQDGGHVETVYAFNSRLAG